MKNLLYCAAALVVAFFAASCQQESLETVGNGAVTFTVSAPGGMDTKAIADGMNVNEVHYAVYKTNDNEEYSVAKGTNPLAQGVVPMKDKEATVSLELLQDQYYTVIFWAQVRDAGHYELGDLRKITAKNLSTPSNDESRAAFYAVYEFNTKTVQNYEVTLYRPFAQLNLGTSVASLTPTLEGQNTQYSIDVQKSAVTVKNVSNVFSTVNGTADANDDITNTFTEFAIPADAGETLKVNGVDYHYVAMNYVFVPGNDKLVEVTYDITTDKGLVNNTIKNVPLKKNYRTNIIGNLLTSKTDFEIIVDERFVDSETGELNPDIIVEAWNGTDVKMPKQSTEDPNVYEIEYPSELAWLSAAVNGTLPDTKANLPADAFKGKTFKLTKDVDLAGKEWTPIGNSTNKFQGTFDGNGKTVKNLLITGNNDYVGLFGFTTDGEIKNLTVENAKVSGGLGVGVVAGSPYTSKYTNITVTGHIEVNGMAYVGGVGGRNAYADWTDITVNADETSYVKANSVENGTAYRTYVGGVVGFNGEGGHSFKKISSNIDVTGSTIDVGGLFGIAHYGNKFEDCSCSGNVEITGAAEAADAEEIGGIAGVWMDSDTAPVTFTNVEFTGAVTTNIERETIWYDNLFGKPYNNNGKGKLIVNNAIMVASAAELQAAVDAATDNTAIKFGADIEGNVTVVQKPGVKITIDGAEKNYDGVIKVHGKSQYYEDAALTIQNVNFNSATTYINSDGDPYFNFIEALENGGERYSCNITVDECTFTHETEYIAVGVQIKSSNNAKVLNCTATKMHSLIQAQSCGKNVEVKGCTITDGKNGVAFKQVKNALVEGTTIKASEYGIRFDGNIANYGITVKDNKVEARQPFIVRKMTSQNNTIALEGENTLTPTTAGDYQIIITNGSDDAEYVIPTGTYTLTGAGSFNVYPKLPVAKVGSTEYYSIDDAIANWTHNTTLTLVADVTLSDVVSIKSTEHHILNLGTYTLTAAEGKNAFEIIATGTGAAEQYAITINADATNPGGINAGSKAIVYYDYSKGTAAGADDRPIIKINGGVFNASTSAWGTTGIFFKGGSKARQAATLNISGGEFNCSINGSGKSKLIITGGLFHYSVGSQGDSTAIRLISGGTFKTLGFMTADSNNTKFWFGTSMGNSNVGLYINDDNYLVVGGPVITEFGGKFKAKATNPTKWNSLLQYSSAATNGLYYTNAEMAITKHGEANVVLAQ